MDKLLESTSTADSKEMTPKHKLQSLNLLHTLNYCASSILQYCAHLNTESVSHIAKYGGLWITLRNFSARVGELAVALPSLCDF